MQFAAVEALTFDCYGTLIDWESGILRAAAPVLRMHGVEASDDAILERYASVEAALEGGSYRPYREILTEAMRTLCAAFGITPSRAETVVLVESIASWPPFPDTVETLGKLKQRFKLGIISNVDDDLFASTARQLETDFDWIITAQQARAYKPSLAPFELAEQRMGVQRDRWVHVAQSLFHDHVPARQLGIASVWVNRRHGQHGTGATPRADVRPQLEVPTLAALAELAL